MEPVDDTLGVGELAQLVGVSTHALRIWERRYGSPQPIRRPSGHRRYPAEEVTRLKLVGEAIRLGHRASVTVPADIVTLQKMIEHSSKRDTAGTGNASLPKSEQKAQGDPSVSNFS